MSKAAGATEPLAEDDEHLSRGGRQPGAASWVSLVMGPEGECGPRRRSQAGENNLLLMEVLPGTSSFSKCAS